jgi:predicted PurR-regulated permease PerM
MTWFIPAAIQTASSSEASWASTCIRLMAGIVSRGGRSKGSLRWSTIAASYRPGGRRGFSSGGGPGRGIAARWYCGPAAGDTGRVSSSPPRKRTPATGRRARPTNGKPRARPLADDSTPVVVPAAPAEERDPAGNGAVGGARASDEEIPPWVRRAMALFFTWIVGLVVTYWVVQKLKTVILMVVVALFLALAMEPPVNRLVKRGWSRHGATGLVWGLFLLSTIGFFAAFGSVAVTQASQLVNNTAHYVRNVVNFLNRDFGTSIRAQGLINNLESPNGAVQKFARSLANDAPNVALTIGKSLLEIVLTFIFAFYLTADGPKFRRSVCSRLAPRRQQIVLDTWELAVEKTGAYLYSRALQAVICTAAVWIFLFALGIPGSLALAIFTGVVSQFVPTFGTYLALILPTLVALLYSPVDTIWVLAYLIGYQQFENYILGPRIARRTLRIHPALTIGSVFAGALLLGPVGALLALPATAVIQALVSTYTDEQEVIETDLTAEPRERTRRIRIPRFSLRRRAQRSEPDAEPTPAAPDDLKEVAAPARSTPSRRKPRRRPSR